MVVLAVVDRAYRFVIFFTLVGVVLEVLVIFLFQFFLGFRVLLILGVRSVVVVTGLVMEVFILLIIATPFGSGGSWCWGGGGGRFLFMSPRRPMVPNCGFLLPLGRTAVPCWGLPGRLRLESCAYGLAFGKAVLA